jgi:hypothetical protein
MAADSTVDGVVTLVQERRFQLVDDSGVAHLFLIAAEAPFDATQLESCAQSARRVRVTSRPADGLIARLAISVSLDTAKDAHETSTT